MFLKRNLRQADVCPCLSPGAIYMYMTIIFKHLSETPWPISAKFHVQPPHAPREGITKVCINGLGHMTEMAAMPIYDKNLQKSSSIELSPIIFKLGMEHYVIKLYKVYINNDPVLTLTYLTTMSDLTNLVYVLEVGPYMVGPYFR